MTTTDANGIVFYQASDPVSPLHTLLNGGQQSVSDAITTINTKSLITPVANAAARTAAVNARIAAGQPVTTAAPLYVTKADELERKRLQVSYDGTNWHPYMSGDTGWVACTSVPGFSAANLFVRRQGSYVTLRGTASPTAAGSLANGVLTPIANAPVGYRPAASYYYGGGIVVSTPTGFNYIWNISATGDIQVRSLGQTLAYSTNTSFAPPSGWHID